MGIMSAIETIQAAIEKLAALKAESTTGPWRFQKCDRRHVTHAIFGLNPGQEVIGATPNYGGLWSAVDGELIVVLHRMIGPNLALLQDTQRALLDPMFGRLTENVYAYQIALAAAILGEES